MPCPNDNYGNHVYFSQIINFMNNIFFRKMSRILSDDIIADLLNGDVSDIEEFDEGDDISYENLDELLLEFPDTVEVIIIFVQTFSFYIPYKIKRVEIVH